MSPVAARMGKLFSYGRSVCKRLFTVENMANRSLIFAHTNRQSNRFIRANAGGDKLGGVA